MKRVRLRKLAGGLRMRSRDNLIRLRDTRLAPIGITDYRMLLLLPLMLGLIALTALWRQSGVEKATFRPTENELQTPLAGWAVHTDTWGEDCSLNTSLVYAEVTWAELEAEKGKYDFEAFEAKNHLHEWWASGKKLILRFVIDRVGEEGHKDIPDWLIEEMGGERLAGSFYQTEEGYGFAPDYSSIPMREAHYRAINALAARYGAHSGVAYIEIGSLGQDGLWTVDLSAEDAEPLPVSSVSREYAWHYTNAFSDKLMLMCRPYKEAELLSVGLFNPRLGDFEYTWKYLDSIDAGGYDEQIETDLVPMADFYKESPSGAHIPKDIDLETLLTEHKAELARQISESKLSYVVIDQSISDLSEESIQILQNLDEMIGYRMWIRSAQWDAKIHTTMRCTVHLRFRNDGTTPLHEGWAVALALFDGERMIWWQKTEADTSMILPGETELRTWIDIPYGTPVGEYTIKVGILNPDTDRPGVPLEMAECDEKTLWTELGTVRVIS